MTNYITTYCLVNRGKKKRKVKITMKAHGVLAGLVVSSNNKIISDTEQFALSNDDFTLFHEFEYEKTIPPETEVIFHVEHTLLAISNGRVIHKAFLD